MERPRLIGLIRVSTGKQADSGLGLEAQTAAIERYRASVDGVVIRTYREVESGKHDSIEDRPELQAAVFHASRSGAVLVIAKMDRLVRSVEVGAYLKHSRIKFVACDNPYANELTIDILVAIAANEARAISTRTKEALAARKARGLPMGAHLPGARPLSHEAQIMGSIKSAKRRRRKTIEAYSDLVRIIAAMRSEGRTFKEIAAHLNEMGHTTRANRPWSRLQVSRVLERGKASS